jgi:hypothetical protein
VHTFLNPIPSSQSGEDDDSKDNTPNETTTSSLTPDDNEAALLSPTHHQPLTPSASLNFTTVSEIDRHAPVLEDSGEWDRVEEEPVANELEESAVDITINGHGMAASQPEVSLFSDPCLFVLILCRRPWTGQLRMKAGYRPSPVSKRALGTRDPSPPSRMGEQQLRQKQRLQQRWRTRRARKWRRRLWLRKSMMGSKRRVGAGDREEAGEEDRSEVGITAVIIGASEVAMVGDSEENVV